MVQVQQLGEACAMRVTHDLSTSSREEAFLLVGELVEHEVCDCEACCEVSGDIREGIVQGVGKWNGIAIQHLEIVACQYIISPGMPPYQTPNTASPKNSSLSLDSLRNVGICSSRSFSSLIATRTCSSNDLCTNACRYKSMLVMSSGFTIPFVHEVT